MLPAAFLHCDPASPSSCSLSRLRMTGSECAFAITITHRADDDSLGFSATAVGKGKPRRFHVNISFLIALDSFFPARNRDSRGSNDRAPRDSTSITHSWQPSHVQPDG